MARTLWFALFVCFLAGCSPTKSIYTSDSPLSPKIVRTRDRILSAHIPEHWLLGSEDTLAPALQLWIVRDDLRASIAIRELHLDRLAAKRVEVDGLDLLAQFSASFRNQRGELNLEELQTEKFSMINFKCAGYEITAGTYRIRLVVFSAGGKFYECEASPLKGTWRTDDVNRLFAVQQSFLAGLTANLILN